MNAKNAVAVAVVLLTAGFPLLAGAETVKIEDSHGEQVSMEIHRPPDFADGQAHSILVSPGDYYWQDRPSQPGWIVVVSDGFYGQGRVERSKLVLDYLRAQFKPRNGGFHLAGWSANSAGIFEIAMAYPSEILSVTGIAGMPGQGSEADLGKLKAIRVQFIVGEKDTYWRQGSERWHRQMQKEGIRSSLEIIAKGEHVMPEIANEPIFERMNALVAEIEAAGQ